MELLAPLPELETLSAVIGTRPTLVTHGVDITAWRVGGKFSLVNCIAYVEGDGTDRTVSSPTSGANGVEAWTYKATKAGTYRWVLVGYLNAGNDVVAVAA